MFSTSRLCSRIGLAVFTLCACFSFALSPVAAWEAPKIPKPASAPNFPERPIDFICGWGVGGGADMVSRKLCDLVRRHYGITFVVTNMPGASGTKGLDYAMRQPHDGYTVFFLAWDGYMNYLLKKTTWKPEELDLILCAQNMPGAYYVHGDDSRFKTWQDVIDYSKKNPYKLRLSDVGRGGLGDFTLNLWEKGTGLKLTYVPYDAPAQRYAAFSGKHCDLLYEQPGDIAAILEAGARPLVFMAKQRLPEFPNVPTSVELGHDITISLWRGVAVTSDMPQDIKDYLTKVFGAVCSSPEYKAFLKQNMCARDSVLVGKDARKMFMDEYRVVAGMMNTKK